MEMLTGNMGSQAPSSKGKQQLAIYIGALLLSRLQKVDNAATGDK
jgi:hypothetical protein